MALKFIPFLILCAVISWLSHLPGEAISYPMPFDGVDKLVHVFGFTAVGLSAIWPLKNHFGFALALGSGFGLVDEWHQHFIPGRHSDALDVVADALGVLIGCAIGASIFHSKGKADDVI